MSALRPSLVAVISVLILAGLLVLPLPASAASAVSGQDAIHEVMPGDDLRLIAGYYYGDTRQWERIWQANKDQVKNPNRIEKGSLLRIPDATIPAKLYTDFTAHARRPSVPPLGPPATEARPAPPATTKEPAALPTVPTPPAPPASADQPSKPGVPSGLISPPTKPPTAPSR